MLNKFYLISIFLCSLILACQNSEQKPKQAVSPQSIHYSQKSNLGLLFSPDGRQLIFRASDGEKEFLVINGKESKKYDRIGKILFSPNSQSLAYVAATKDKEFVVYNEKEGKRYDFVSDNSMAYSSDSKNLAYIAQLERAYQVVVNAEEGKAYPYVSVIGNYTAPLSFDAKNQVIYKATLSSGDPRQVLVVIGKQEGKSYEYIDQLRVNKKDKQVRYTARAESKNFLVLHHGASKVYSTSYPIHLSADGEKVAFIRRGKREKLIVHDQVEASYENIEHFEFSPKGELILIASEKVSPDQVKAYLVVAGKIQENVLDFKSQKNFYPKIRPLPNQNLQHPKSGKISYILTKKDQSQVVTGGQVGKAYPYINEVEVSADGQSIAYVGSAQDRVGSTTLFFPSNNPPEELVLNGKVQARFEEISELQFSEGSPEGKKRFACRVRERDQEFVYLDGKKIGPYDQVGHLSFSLEGDQFAFVGRRGDQMVVWQDGQESKTYPRIIVLESPSKKENHGNDFQVVSINGGSLKSYFKNVVGKKRIYEDLVYEMYLNDRLIIRDTSATTYAVPEFSAKLGSWSSREALLFTQHQGDGCPITYFILETASEWDDQVKGTLIKDWKFSEHFGNCNSLEKIQMDPPSHETDQEDMEQSFTFHFPGNSDTDRPKQSWKYQDKKLTQLSQ